MWPSEGSASFWYDAANIGLVIGLALGVVSTVTVVWMGNVKETYLRIELKDKDLKIIEAGDKASQARLETKRLETDNLKLAEQVEREKLERLEMERAVAPRLLVGQNEIGDRLKAKFPNMRVRIVSLADPEAWRVAGQIAAVTYRAGWPIISMEKFLNPDSALSAHIAFFDGVNINVTPRPEGGQLAAAEAFIAELRASKIAAKLGITIDNPPPDTLTIVVGLKPTDYFDRNNKGNRGNAIYMNVINHF